MTGNKQTEFLYRRVTTCALNTPFEMHFNARNIKGENSGQKPKMVYTPSATAQSEMTEKIVSITQSHHQQSPQTADLEANGDMPFQLGH